MQFVDNSGNMISFAQLKALFPLCSFPTNPVQADVEFLGWNVVAEVTPPIPPNGYYIVTEGTAGLVNGVWTQTWATTPIGIANAQLQQTQILSSACQNALISGFNSSALGSAYTYPSDMTSQQNLSSAVLGSMMPGIASTWTTQFWCQDSSGTWAWVAHTAAQIQQVQNDWNTARLALQTQYATLVSQVSAATNVDAVAAVAWTVPATS